MNRISSLSLLLLLLPTCVPASGRDSGKSVRNLLATRLPSLGHRNWIVVADSAYPLQTAPGVETLTVGAGQVEVVREVLAALKKAKHVRPTIYMDAELPFVAETSAPGVSRYRSSIATVLRGRAVQSLKHEEIIAKLDEAGKTFHVLLIKTPLTFPYTSVFFQLQCGYWSDTAERQLRDAMKRAGK